MSLIDATQQELHAALAAADLILQHITRLDQADSEQTLAQLMPGLLESLGVYTLSERAYLFTWLDEEKTAFRMMHEWCAPGVRPTLAEMQHLQTVDLPHWLPQLQTGAPLICPDWERARAVMPHEYAMFTGQNIRSLIILPIFSNKTLGGFLGLDNPEQRTSALSVRLLASVAGHLGSVRENLRMVAALEEKQRALQASLDALAAETQLLDRQRCLLEQALAEATLNNEIISAISKIYWMIHRMDLTANTYEEISAGEEPHHLTGKHGTIQEGIRHARENIVAPEFQERMRAFLDVQTLPERLRDVETVATEYQARGGSWHIARFIAKKRDASGRVTHVLYLVREINQEKRQEMEYKQRLAHIAEEAQRANIAKTDFLRRMSHDLRTPISGIRGMMEIANHYPNDPQKQQECRDKVLEASGYLLELVNSVLDMNKLESGKIVLEHRPFDLNALLRESNSLVELPAHERAITLRIENEPFAHPHLLGSPLHCKQILQNLVGNAIKYTPRGGTITLTGQELSCDGKTATFLFRCADTGRGMSPEFLAHAFEPFAQEEYSARTDYMGTGLGLTIAHQLADLMGGTLQLQSTQNVGTVITLTLPFALNPDGITPQPETAQPAPPVRGLRVLLAEDNALNLEIACFLLENAGLHVTAVQDGCAALDAFSAAPEGQFDLILLDVMMPRMNGLDAARAIRALPRHDAQSIPIFAMTANAFSDDVELSRNAGMDEHLSKPLHEQELLAAIRRHVPARRF